MALAVHNGGSGSIFFSSLSLLCFSFSSLLLLLLFFIRSSPSFLFSFVLFSSVLFFSFPPFSFFFYSVLCVLSLFFLFFLFFLFSFSPLFFVLPPVFIGKNKGGTLLGWPLCYCPMTVGRACSLLFSLPVVGNGSKVIQVGLWSESF